jgi:hypothetical protein
VRFTGNDIAIELDYNTTGANLQFFKEAGYGEPIFDFLLFSIDPNLHINKKTVSAVTT